jgi:hypothetical protein
MTVVVRRTTSGTVLARPGAMHVVSTLTSVAAPGDGASAWHAVKEFFSAAGADTGHALIAILKTIAYAPKMLIIAGAALAMIVVFTCVFVGLMTIAYRKLFVLVIGVVAIVRAIRSGTGSNNTVKRVVFAIAVICAVAALLELGATFLPLADRISIADAVRLPGHLEREISRIAAAVWSWWGL